MLATIISGFFAAVLAPWINRVAGRVAGAMLALMPLGMFLYFLTLAPAVLRGETFIERNPWVAALNVELSFLLDGLSLLFAMLITGIGAFIVWYAGPYLEDHRDRGRFFGWLLLFMASMLGLVLADNIVTLFIFWELTSISSYFLIGFDHHREHARKCALQALLVTGFGGIALLAGLVLLSVAGGGSFELSALLTDVDRIRDHGLYLPIVLLVLLGAATKSAQFPFHFWLPNAMEAPTPVSAYLHSSTMVKAGVYLLARLSPALGGTDLWHITLMIVGGVTMLIGAYLAIRQAYLKRILAYSTISALGILVFLIGIADPRDEALAAEAGAAFAVFLLAHALYKATLFLIAGSVTYATEVKDVRKLGGLGRLMPMTAMAALLAGLSMAGIPPLLGFLGKEMLLATALHRASWDEVATAAAAVTGLLFVIVAAMIGWQPFFGEKRATPTPAREVPTPMWAGALIMAGLGLLAGLFPSLIAALTGAVATSVFGSHEPVTLSLWHGVNLPLILSIAAIVLGILAFTQRSRMERWLSPLDTAGRVGPAAWYEWSVGGLMRIATFQTRALQSGYLRVYLFITIATTVGLAGWAVLRLDALPLLGEWPAEGMLVFVYENLYLLIIAAIMLIAVYGAVHLKSRLSAIASLGTVGYGVALVYTFHGAPDLAITQFLIETLTVILFVLVFYHLPEYPKISSLPERVRDVLISVSAGATMTVLVLVATHVQTHEKVSDWLSEHSYTEGHGRNVVNVILVDFRAIDTLGEITVLSISAIGVFALLKLYPGRARPAAERGEQ